MKKTSLMRIFILLLALGILFSNGLIAQDKNEKEIKIKTSIHCSNCKAKVEDCLKDSEGINQYTVNLEDKTVTVKYNPDKTNPDQIRQAIAKSGYDADDVKAAKSGCTESKKCSKDKSCKKTCDKKKPIE